MAVEHQGFEGHVRSLPNSRKAMSDPVEPQQVPTSRLRKRDVSRTYTGPERSTLPSRSQQEKYFQRVANENILPTRAHKWLGFGGWIFGGSKLKLRC